MNFIFLARLYFCSRKKISFQFSFLFYLFWLHGFSVWFVVESGMVSSIRAKNLSLSWKITRAQVSHNFFNLEKVTQVIIILQEIPFLLENYIKLVVCVVNISLKMDSSSSPRVFLVLSALLLVCFVGLGKRERWW